LCTRRRGRSFSKVAQTKTPLSEKVYISGQKTLAEKALHIGDFFAIMKLQMTQKYPFRKSIPFRMGIVFSICHLTHTKEEHTYVRKKVFSAVFVSRADGQHAGRLQQTAG